MHLYNTLTRRIETFVPADPARVTLYVCGPTVYNYIHIGNARTFLVFDLLARTLKRRYPHVVYARNITDIDDKINAAARELGSPIGTITAQYDAAFTEDMTGLGLLVPDVVPYATAHIAQIIAMIERLIASGHAYAAEGHALFSVGSFADYGKLSRRDPEDMLAGARIDVAPYKRDAGDFVLWKPSDETLPGWDSPWGRGRPGWHIECSAMAEAHLGDSIDIHGGGIDLQFPHHENEVAQSQCAHGGKIFARYWMHSGMLNLGGSKMSKSLGNTFRVHDLLKDVPAEALRYALLSGHYRQPLDWTDGLIEQSERTLTRLYNTLRDFMDIKAESIIPASIEAALDDDLNTPQVLAEIARINSRLSYVRAQRDSAASLRHRTGRLRRLDAEHLFGQIEPDVVNPFSLQSWLDNGIDLDGDAYDSFIVESSKIAAPIKQDLLGAGLALGLLQQLPSDYLGESGDDSWIQSLIDERAEAKKSGDYIAADGIRAKLASKGIGLNDTPHGAKWFRIDPMKKQETLTITSGWKDKPDKE